MSLATIENGFRKTGICPFNPEAMDKTRLILMDNNNGTTIFIITTHTRYNIAAKTWKI